MNKKKKPQGKLNEDIIFEGIVQGKKLKDIAKEAGSLAKSEDNLTGAVIGKVKSSSKLQLRLAQARERGLEVSNEVMESLYTRILEKNDVDNLTPIQALDTLNRTTNTIATLAKQEAGSAKSAHTNIQINIIQPNKDAPF